jgi:hypothetical protein
MFCLEKNEMEWHVTRMGDMRNTYRIWLVNLKGRGYLGDVGVDGRVIFK